MMTELTQLLDDLVRSVRAGRRREIIAVDRLEEELRKTIRDEVRMALMERDREGNDA